MMQTSIAPDLNAAQVPPELSRIVRLDDITATANTITLDATVRECMLLAARFELSYLRSLSAEITYRRVRSGSMIRIDGRITASYGQLCGMTLAPIPMVMEESFQSEYTLAPWEKYSDFDLDQPEILTDDFIDMGEVVAEYFSLALDPYARRAGAERLPELAQYLSDAVQELLASNAPHAVVAEPVTAPAPAAAETSSTVVTIDSEMAAVSLGTVTFISAVNEIPETANFVPDQLDAAPISVPEAEIPAESAPESEPAYESLFMKYLRRLRAA